MESFKLNKKTWSITAAYDLVLILISYILLFLWSLWMTSFLSKINLDVSALTEETIRDVASLKSFYYGTIISLFVLAIFLFFIWCFFKGILWSVILNKHFDLKYYSRFILLNLTCIPLFIILFFIFLLITQIINYLIFLTPALMQNNLIAVLITSLIFFIVFMPIIVYMMILPSLVYYYFTKKNDMVFSFSKMFDIAVRKIHLFYVPCLLITFVFVLISIITIPLRVLPESIIFLVFLLIFIFYIAWARMYIISFTESFSKNHHKI